MRKQWKRIMRRIIACVLIVALVLPNTVVAAPKPEINKKSIILCKKEKYQLKISHQRKKPKWKTTNKKVVSVSKNGFIKGKKSGTATITGYAGGKKYKCKVTVADTKKSVYAGKTISLKSKSLKKYKKWNSSSTKIATVNKSGKVKTKKAGTVVITAKYKKKTYRFKLTVKKPEPATIYVDKYSNEAITTDKSDYVLSGTIKSKREIKKVSASYNSDSNTKTKSLTINGTKKWKTKKIPLDIGKNYINLKVALYSGKLVSKVIKVIRISKEVSLNKEVNVINPDEKKELETIKEIRTEIFDMITNDNGTEDTSDDEILLAVYNENPLLQKIKKREIKKDEIIYIPENKYFVDGLTQKYLYCDDNYTGDLVYDKDQCEIIHLGNVDFSELFSDDVCLQTEGVNEKSSIAFVYTPSEKSSEFATYANNDKEDKPKKEGGIQYGELEEQLNDLERYKINIDKNNLENSSFKLDLNDIIIYDKDNNTSTTEDQIKLGGKIEYVHFNPVLNFDYKFKKKRLNSAQATIEYDQINKASLTWGAETESVNSIVKDFGLTVKNDKKFSVGPVKVALSGVDMKNSIILAAVGVNLDPKINIKFGMKKITKVPRLYFAIILDMDGNIEVKTTLSFVQKSYHKTGILLKCNPKNLSENLLTTEEKKNALLKSSKRTGSFAFYNACTKAKGVENAQPYANMTLSCEGEATYNMGIGLGMGVGVLGIIPVWAKIRLLNEASLNGRFKTVVANYEKDAPEYTTPKFTLNYEGNALFKDALKLDTQVDARLKVKEPIDKKIFNVNKHPFVLRLIDQGFFASAFNGKVVDEDGDAIPNAKVSVIDSKSKKTLFNAVHTDESGKYDINNFYYANDDFSKKKLELLITKEGYEDYIDANFITADYKNAYIIQLKEKEKMDEEIDKISNPANGSWDCIEFGKYWQNDTNKDGKVDENDEKEPIKWRVMQKYPVNKVAFLISDKILDVKPFNKTKSTVWKKSMIRSYLNGYSASENDDGIDFSGTGKNFMQNAFTKKDQKHLEDRLLDSDNNPSGDLVHIAAPYFINSSQYGFDGNKSRITETTDYAKQKAGSDYVKGTYLTGTTTSEGGKKYHCYITENGEIKNPGCADPDTGKYGGIRVIIAIDLKKANWAYAGKTN